MKNKKLLFGVALSVWMLTPCAFAADDNADAKLTTRGYVDSGLSFVYQKAATADSKADVADAKAEAVDDRVDTLESVVGATASDGLRGDVATLQGNVSTLQTDVSTLQAASKTYTGGTGITVTAGQGNNPSTINLNLNNPTNGASYVFQSDGSTGGSWVALSVENNWDASAEARITGQQNPD
ncbi:MAG: hypothetical protein J6W41_03345 [Alphaproteobacteria bacterium]|nr:hypothetical protein [Alphaproteobacteria bacterium]